jgi:DNA-binding response OmpR family regulator
MYSRPFVVDEASIEYNVLMAKTSVLIIEDEHALREALEQKLTHEGFEVITAADGLAGIGQALAHHPSVILLDIMLPGLNGMDLLQELRDDPWGMDAKVIILSNEGDTSTILQGVKHNSQGYFIKAETSLDTIVNAIKSLAQ